MSAIPPELSGSSEAEEFFEALGVPFLPEVLARHRLHIMKLFGAAAERWLDASAPGGAAERRAALTRALSDAYAAFAANRPLPTSARPLARERLVQLGPRRPPDGSRS